MIYFTSDLHLGQANITSLSHRPYANIVEHDDALMDNWNSVVSPQDTIYVLGDFSFRARPEGYFHRLNGQKHLIIGNHDHKRTRRLPWQSIAHYGELKIDGTLYVLSHYAFRVWNKCHYGSRNLHGHSHGTLTGGNDQQLDVGVDCWAYRPITAAQIEDRLRTLPPYRSPDMHKPSCAK